MEGRIVCRRARRARVAGNDVHCSNRCGGWGSSQTGLGITGPQPRLHRGQRYTPCHSTPPNATLLRPSTCTKPWTAAVRVGDAGLDDLDDLDGSSLRCAPITARLHPVHLSLRGQRFSSTLRTPTPARSTYDCKLS